MKRIVSVSIGSSKRDHKAELRVLGEDVIVERIGTDGDIDKAIRVIRDLDGKVDAFGMGGIDLYIWHGGKRYTFREAKRIARAAQKTPIVDGSGLKNTLERHVIELLWRDHRGLLQNKRVLMVCAMDRFGMAEAVDSLDCEVLYGDLIFALGLPLPLANLKALGRVARVLAPFIVQLPFSLLYPTGKKQDESRQQTKFARYYQWADVIAGDFHMIKKYLPPDLAGKTVITNTVTQGDVDLLQSIGVAHLVTTTPHICGRSFGTNVIEGLLVALLGKPVDSITPQDYRGILEKLEFQPWIHDFSSGTEA